MKAGIRMQQENCGGLRRQQTCFQVLCKLEVKARRLFIPAVVNTCSQVLIVQSSEHLTNISPPHSSHSYPADQLIAASGRLSLGLWLCRRLSLEHCPVSTRGYGGFKTRRAPPSVNSELKALFAVQQSDTRSPL